MRKLVLSGLAAWLLGWGTAAAQTLMPPPYAPAPYPHGPYPHGPYPHGPYPHGPYPHGPYPAAGYQSSPYPPAAHWPMPPAIPPALAHAAMPLAPAAAPPHSMPQNRWPAPALVKSYGAYNFADYDASPSALRPVAQGPGDQFLPPPPTPDTNSKPEALPAPLLVGPKAKFPSLPTPSPDGKGWIPPPPSPGAQDWTPPPPAPDAKGWTPPTPTPDGKGWTPPPPKIEPKNWFPLPPTPEPGGPTPGMELLPSPARAFDGAAPHAGTDIHPVAFVPSEPQEPYMVGYVEDTSPLFFDYLAPNPKARSFHYGMADFLLWRFKEQDVPGTLPVVLDDLPANTRESTLPESVSLGDLPFVGGRLTVGRWLATTKAPMALEASGFYLAPRDDSALFAFKDQAIAEPLLFASILGETVALTSSAQFWGAEVNLRAECYRWCRGAYSGYIDVLGGFRYLDLKESLRLRGDIDYEGDITEDFTIATIDDFATRNRIFAGQLGVEATLKKGHWIFTIYGKVGGGGNRQIVNISGRTELITATGTQNFDNGFLAQASNVGRYSRNQLTVIPEGGCSLTYEFNKHVRLGGSYSFLYLSNVVRPGDEIDPFEVTTAPTFILGTPAPTPTFEFRDANFWAQGLHVRLELSY